MSMVARQMEPKNMTDETLAYREEAARLAARANARAKAAADTKKSTLNDTLNQVSPYHGVSEHFVKDFEPVALDVAVTGRRLAQMRRGSGEIDPDGHLSGAKSKPIRWEPYIDEETKAVHEASVQAAAKEQVAAIQADLNARQNGDGLVGVLHDQLRDERDRGVKLQERLDAALREAQELSVRAARAEAKLEMTEAMMAKMDTSAPTTKVK